MRKTELLRVPVHPGLKEVLRTVASEHGLSLGEFVKTETNYRTVPLHPQLREILGRLTDGCSSTHNRRRRDGAAGSRPRWIDAIGTGSSSGGGPGPSRICRDLFGVSRCATICSTWWRS